MLNVDGWSVWWLLLGLKFFGFFFGKTMMYLWISHSIRVEKSCGDCWRKIAIRCVLILCESLPQPLESCVYDGVGVCSCVFKYVCIGSLDLDNGSGNVDIFIGLH